MNHLVSPNMIDTLERALETAAEVVLRDPSKLPIFERIDSELRAAKARLALRAINDPISRAREMAKIKRAELTPDFAL